MSSSSVAQNVAAKVSTMGRAEQQQQQQQHGKERLSSSSSSRRLPRSGGEVESEVMPEWKLKCLCAEHGVPLIMSGTLNMGGCF